MLLDFADPFKAQHGTEACEQQHSVIFIHKFDEHKHKRKRQRRVFYPFAVGKSRLALQKAMSTETTEENVKKHLQYKLYLKELRKTLKEAQKDNWNLIG